MYQQLQVDAEDFIGLFGLATDRYAILSPRFPKFGAMEVPVLRTHIYGTGLIGMFCAGNSNGLLVPYFVSDRELERVREFLGGMGVRIGKVEDKYTALGNLIASNDNAAVVSPKLKDTKLIEETLGVKVKSMAVGGHEEVGACLAVTNRGFLAHPDAESELGELSKILGVNGTTGTVNYGVPFVKSGIIANSDGYMTGLRTTGIELGRIDEGLGFI